MPHNYPSFDPLDWNTIQPHFDALLAAELTATTAREWLQVWSDLVSVLDETSAQIYREITENTADAAADARFKTLVTQILPAAARAEQALKQKYLVVPGYTPTDETALLYKRLHNEADLFREENVAIQSELRLLDKQYDEIIGGLSVVWEGSAYSIPQANALLHSPDRTARESIWRQALAAYLARREDLNTLFLEMLGRRRRLAANAGLQDFRAYQWREMARFDYTPADCLTFHDAIATEVVPLTTDLYRSLAADLGLGTLRPWETSLEGAWVATLDRRPTPIAPFESVAALEETGQGVFSRVHPRFGDDYASMRDGFLDLAARPGKAPGGYCNGFPVSGKPYIFMNAAGTVTNFTTLMHEGGHAFHFAESYRQQSLRWNYNGPMEFCEVASMGMELLTTPYWAQDQGGYYSASDARRALAEELTGIVCFLPYMAVMDSFQHWLYAEAPVEVDAADIDRKWSELWDRYLPGIDYSGLQAEKETGWHRKGHIFGVPFYYVEYGLAQLGALQIWRNALQDQGQAVAHYRTALALGYTRSLPELFTAAGARFAFDRQTVGELVALVRRQLDLLGA